MQIGLILEPRVVRRFFDRGVDRVQSQRQPVATAVFVEASGIELAVVEQVAVGGAVVWIEAAVRDELVDELIDLVVAHEGSKRLTFLSGDGAGRFSTKIELDIAIQPRALAIADFDGNGTQDLALTNAQEAGIVVLLADGKRGFGAPIPFIVGINPSSLAAADLNHDQRPDLVTANFVPDHGTLGVLINQSR